MSEKGELRRKRKAARKGGRPLLGDLALDRGPEPVEFAETPRGRVARERWARSYDALNGAPENDGDR